MTSSSASASSADGYGSNSLNTLSASASGTGNTITDTTEALEKAFDFHAGTKDETGDSSTNDRMLRRQRGGRTHKGGGLATSGHHPAGDGRRLKGGSQYSFSTPEFAVQTAGDVVDGSEHHVTTQFWYSILFLTLGIWCVLPLVCLAAIFWRSSDRMAQLVARAALVVFVVICLVGG